MPRKQEHEEENKLPRSAAEAEHGPCEKEKTAEYGSQPLIMSWAKSRGGANTNEKATSMQAGENAPPISDSPAIKKRLLWQANHRCEKTRALVNLSRKRPKRFGSTTPIHASMLQVLGNIVPPESFGSELAPLTTSPERFGRHGERHCAPGQA